MGFIEEKKENDSLSGANIHHDTGFQADITKDDEKNKTCSFDMEENVGQQGEQQGQPHRSCMIDLPEAKQEQVANINHVSNNGLFDQAAQTAQQMLAHASLSQQQQHIQQLAQQPGIALDIAALSMLPQQSLGYLTQSPANSVPGSSLNQFAMQNTLVQNHNQGVSQVQASALIGSAGLFAPNLVQQTSGVSGSAVISNGFSLGQQPVQQQQAQQISSSGSSISSAAGFSSAFPNTHQSISAISPTNQITPSTVMPQQLLSSVPFAAPPIFGPALPPASLTLSPQLAIPHYIPPTPASWGAPLPTLTVQDRPLVPPIYNGINPNYPKAQMLHAHPPIFCVHEFLTPAECDFLIEAASDAFGPAPVVGKGQGEVSPSRTSSTCYLAREDLPEVRTVMNHS